MRIRTLLSQLGIFSLLATSLAVPTYLAPPAHAAGTFTLSGEASQNAAGYLEVVSDASPGSGVVTFSPVPATFADLVTLSTDFNVTDDNCGGGSPRFQINVPVGTGSKNIFVYLGPSPNYNTCTQNTWTPSGNLLGSGKTIDTSQLPGGTFYHSYNAALAAYGTKTINSIKLVVDAGWSQGDGEQTVLFDNTTINNDLYNYTVVASSSSSVPASSSSSSTSSLPSCGADGSDVLAHWKFNEGSGTAVADSTGNGHNGTTQSGASFTNLAAPTAFSNPFAGSFDGVDDRVNAPDTLLELGNNNFTVATWVKTTSGDRAVLGHFDNPGSGYRGWGLYLYGSNRVNFFGYGTAGANDTSHAATVLNGAWHHLAGVYSRSGSSLTIRTYVDGVLVGTNTANVGNIAVDTPMRLGDYTFQPNFSGSLDDVLVYNRALSAGEVSGLAAGNCPPTGSSSSSAPTSSSSSSVSSAPTGSSSSSSSVPSGLTCNGKAATIVGTNGPNTLYGTDGDDVIVALGGKDKVYGKKGNDTICLGDGKDYVEAGKGNDWVDGGTGKDTVYGDEGDDTLFGGNGNDVVNGDDGTDTLSGGQGNDDVGGGKGNDSLDGGPNTDKCDQDQGTGSIVNCEKKPKNGWHWGWWN